MAANQITGRSAFLALLKDEGITHLFGNPGTTELPIMHALKDHPDLTYVMGMRGIRRRGDGGRLFARNRRTGCLQCPCRAGSRQCDGRPL